MCLALPLPFTRWPARPGAFHLNDLTYLDQLSNRLINLPEVPGLPL
jgi:hypothetical protein